MPKEKPALIVKNKNASRNYKLDETFEAGIVLEGWEVKSLRESKVDVKNSYVNIRKGEAWLIGVKIDSPASLQLESVDITKSCLLYTSPSPRDRTRSRMPSSA